MLHTLSPDAILPRPGLANKAVLAMFIGTFAGLTLGARRDSQVCVPQIIILYTLERLRSPQHTAYQRQVQQGSVA